LEAHRARNEQADEVRVLARHPDRQLLVVRLVLGEQAARLHRHRRQAVLEDVLFDHEVGFLEGCLGDFGARVGQIPGYVVGGALIASVMSMRLMRACAKGLRTKAAYAAPWRVKSSM